MSARALGVQSALGAPAATAVYRSAYALVALAIVGLTVFAPSNDAALALDRFTGSSIVRDRVLATHLGNETFTATGSLSGAVGWLGALVEVLLSRGNGLVATFGAGIAALFTFAMVERRATRFGGRVLGLAAAVLAIACALGSFGATGGIFTAAFAIALAEILDRPGPRAAIAATLLSIVWCNVAPQGLLAPAIAVLFGLGAHIEKRDEEERRWRWIALAGTTLALLATPAFIAYPAIAFEALRVDHGLDGVVAYYPADVAQLAYRIGFPLIAFVAFGVGIRERRAGDVSVLLATGFLALTNGSYLPVFGVLVAPLFAASAASALGGALPDVRAFSRNDAFVALAALLVALVAGVGLAPHERSAAPGFALAANLAADGRPHRLLCSNVEWCDAALGDGTSQTRVFMDGRVGAYPEAVRTAQRDIVRLKNHWRRLLKDRDVDTILAKKDRPLSLFVSLMPGWSVASSDDSAVLYERADVQR